MNPPSNQVPVPAAQPVLPGQHDPLNAQPTGQPLGQPTDQPIGQPTGQPVQESVAWTITTQITLGPNPIPMTCPHCGTEIQTRTENNMPTMAWIIGLVLCAHG